MLRCCTSLENTLKLMMRLYQSEKAISFFFYMNVLLHADFVYVGIACICVCVIAFIADST